MLANNKTGLNKEEDEEKMEYEYALSQFDPEIFISLEYKQWKAHVNPIVFSRFGKTSYNEERKEPASGKKETSCYFEMQDLQKYLKTQQEGYNGRTAVWNYDKVKPYYSPKSSADKTLVFESRYESGNLSLAAKVSDTEYKLIIQNDTLTKGNTQCKLHFT